MMAIAGKPSSHSVLGGLINLEVDKT